MEKENRLKGQNFLLTGLLVVTVEFSYFQRNKFHEQD